MAEDEEKLCDNCGEVELVSGTFVSDKGDLITSGEFCEICDMFQSTDNFIHEDFEKQYAKREELVEEIERIRCRKLESADEKRAIDCVVHIIKNHGLEE